MPTVMSPAHGRVHIPAWVTDLQAFRRWVYSGDVPQRLRVHFLNGEVWADLNMEEGYSHNLVKNAIYAALVPLTRGRGLFFSDGMTLTNDHLGIGTNPDAMFVSNESLRAKRAELVAGRQAGGEATEVVGSPDLVVEVVSPSSEVKDTEWLMSAYHNAEVREYWLIDARDEDDIRFDILKHEPKEYVAQRKRGAWVKSSLLKKEFRVVWSEGPHGYPEVTLEVR